MKISKLAVPLAMVAGLSLLSGCSGGGASSGGTPATGEPIAVAALSSLTFFPEAPEAVKAVFDDYNAAGGLDGRPIEYTVFDDKTDPATSATAAKDALDSGAIALVGSSSLVDCIANHETWEDNDIVSIQGTGVDPFCFTTPNIAPTNAGPFFDLASTLYNGSETFGYKDICLLLVVDGPPFQAAYEQAVDVWSQTTGNELAYYDPSLTRGQTSYAGQVSALKNEDCDAVAINEVGPSVTAVINEAANQGLDLPFLVLTSCYSEEFASSVSYAGDIHAPAEFAPFTDADDSANAEWIAVMDAHGVAKTSFAQGGYLAAKYFISVLESISGEPTREAFTEAAKGMTTPSEDAMVGTPWIFGDGDAHQANSSTWAVTLKANTNEWISDGGPWVPADEIGWVPTNLG